MAQPARPRASDIYERVRDDAVHELQRPSSGIAFSALFAGFTLGASTLALVIVGDLLGPGRPEELVAALFYPIGYVAVIVGRAQFFTENTLYPVLLSLQQRSALPATARLWAIVFAANLLGAILFAALIVATPAVADSISSALGRLGVEYSAGDFWSNFWSGVVTGWLLALVAWLVEASQTAIAQTAVIWGLAFLVGLGGFDHCIASTVAVVAGLFEGDLGFGEALGWLAPATLGNVAGGVLIVSLLNYGQIAAEREET